jgi:hypothetical protein
VITFSVVVTTTGGASGSESTTVSGFQVTINQICPTTEVAATPAVRAKAYDIPAEDDDP